MTLFRRISWSCVSLLVLACGARIPVDIGEWVEKADEEEATDPDCDRASEVCDSGDGADEEEGGASALFVCRDGETRIDRSLVCNGREDCADGSDELACNITDFTCADGTLVPRDVVCDGNRDCRDGSDEAECIPDPFVCRDGSRVEAQLVCDGREDCADGSDELACDITNFTCADGTVVPRDVVCDGNRDCRDGSDEADCTRVPD